MSQASDMVRKGFGEGDAARDAGLSTPEDIVRYDDIIYGPDPAWQRLDVYRPKATISEDGILTKLPVIFSVHGGGWVYGDKERYQFYCMSLAQRGFAVVNFTYRLAPEFKDPASLEDTNLVVAWILDNAQQFGFDTDHIFGVGDSAGGHKLGLYAAICTNPAFAATFPFTAPDGFVPTAIGLNCGVYTFGDPTALNDLDLLIMKDLLPDGGTPEELEHISTVNFITKNYPPTFYMTCTGDFLKPQASYLSAALLENDIPHEFHYFGNHEEMLGHVFHLNIRSERAKEFNDLECDYFKRFL